MDTPADRIRAIEGSLRCFTYGCLSFVPVAGLVFSVRALLQHHLTNREPSPSWNPAGRYLRVGHFLAWAGGLIWLSALLLALAIVLSNLTL